jgi:hypothetical protein
MSEAEQGAELTGGQEDGGTYDPAVIPHPHTPSSTHLPPPPPPPDGPPVLEQLGASPFPRSRFPFLGLLATIYDHVISHAKTRS